MSDRLPTEQQALARGTKLAIQAAGGLDKCQGETGLSDTQLSRCNSTNHRDSITIRDAVTVDSIGRGTDGWPFILRAQARAIGGVVIVVVPDVDDGPGGVAHSAMQLAAKLGSLSACVVDAVSSGSDGGEDITPAEAALALEHLDRLDQGSAQMRRQLERLRGKGDPPKG